MKKNNSFLYLVLFIAAGLFASCGKYAAESLPMNTVSVGQDSYASVDENSELTIPIKFNSLCDSGIASAGYKVVNNRASEIILVQSPLNPLPFNGKVVDTTIKVPVRLGLLSVVVVITDKDGRVSSKSIDIKSVNPSNATLKTLSGLQMSTDPADNKNFLSLYETTPVFGSATALSKQQRVDLVLVNMNGARFIAPHAYGADANYYNASKAALAGFSKLNYTFVTATKSYVSKANLDALKTDADMAKYLKDSVLAYPAAGGANYNIINADRRVSDSYGASQVSKGFLIGWGYRSHPTATAVLLNESFALIVVSSVTQKTNGHYVITFDVKTPAADQRAAYNLSGIQPYSPYPL